MANQTVDNRYREYRLALPKSVADQVKAAAKERNATEQQLLTEMIILGSAAMRLAEQQEKDKAEEATE